MLNNNNIRNHKLSLIIVNWILWFFGLKRNLGMNKFWASKIIFWRLELRAFCISIWTHWCNRIFIFFANVNFLRINSLSNFLWIHSFTKIYFKWINIFAILWVNLFTYFDFLSTSYFTQNYFFWIIRIILSKSFSNFPLIN